MKNLKYNSIESTASNFGFTLEIHLTEVCNYNCSYCNLHNMNRYDKIDYNKLFSVEYPSNTRAFILGGEPTVDKNLFELIEKLNENQTFYSFTSTKRAQAWRNYLINNKLVIPNKLAPPSFNDVANK